MTDLRGVMPAQRPPVDATVLEEPTSEVPLIKPPDTGSSTDQLAPGTGEPTDGPPEPADLAAPVGTDPAEFEPAEADPAETDPAADPATSVSVTDPEASAGATVPLPSGTDIPAADRTAPEPPPGDIPPAIPPPPAAPEVDDVVQPSFPYRTGEMARMTWQPAPARTEPALEPALEPAAPLAEAEPALAAAAPSVTATGLAMPEAGPVGDEPVAGQPAAPSGPPDRASSGRPGDVAERPIALWSDLAAEQLRDRWRELQGQFIDDPDAAVAGARSLVTEAVRTLADTLLAAQDELDPFRGGDGRVDTETMRVAMRRYREFLERVLAL